MRAPSSTDRRHPRPAAVPLTLTLALLAAGTLGCATDPPEIRGGKAALEEFLRDLRAHEDARLRARATCVVSAEGVRDARSRRVESARRVTVASLDSLVERYAAAQREAEEVYARTGDDDPAVEDRFQAWRAWGRRAETVRAARRAAAQSAREAPRDDVPPTGTLVSLRAHVTVQYAGPLVGPDRIERGVIVRLLRAPGGPWVVYAFDLASDPPGPIPF